MDHIRFFETIAEPSAERLRLFGIAHEAEVESRRVIVSHMVAQNVLTSFDAKLSRYLAAVTGTGLPHATVETRVRDIGSGRNAAPAAPRHAASAPAALALAARAALGAQHRVSVRLGNWNAGEEGLSKERVITASMVEALENALDICARIGAADFLEISGDFDRLIVRPAGSALDVMVIDLQRCTVAVPAAVEGGSPASVSIFDFDSAADSMPGVAAYLARARHAVAAAREAAVRDFREAAEERIMQFDAALGNRPLTGHRLEAASSLVTRLKAVLGDALAGLSEAARVTALDWAALMPSGAAATRETRPQPIC